MGGRPRAIVCDDAPGFRALMSALLAEAGLDVTATGETWDEAERLAPDAEVVVLDLWMPHLDIPALGRVRTCARQATVAVVTALPAEEAAGHIGSIAIDLLLSKSAPPQHVATAIATHALARA